jgi:hypothetical protein
MNRGAEGVGKSALPASERTPPTLAQMGLTHNESSRYQQLAAMPAEHFETAVQTAKATAGEVTTDFMLREAWRASPTTARYGPAADARNRGPRAAAGR